MDKRLEMDKEQQIEDALVVYEYLILQHAALICILVRKNSILINASVFNKIHFETLEMEIHSIRTSSIGQSRNVSCEPRNINGLCC